MSSTFNPILSIFNAFLSIFIHWTTFYPLDHWVVGFVAICAYMGEGNWKVTSDHEVVTIPSTNDNVIYEQPLIQLF